MKPTGDVAGIVAFGKEALVERLPSELEDIDRIASTPVKRATDIGAALRLATALFPDDAQKRIVLLSDGNDTTGGGPGRGGARGDARRPDRDPGDRPRRRRRGARRAAHDAVDRAPRRIGRGGRRDPLVGRAAGDRPPVRRRRARRHAAGRARGGRRPGSPSTSSPPRPASTRSGPSSRPPATRSARTTGPTRTRSSRASRGRWSWPATTRSRAELVAALESAAPAGRHDRPRGAADRPRRPRHLRQHRARRRPADPAVTTGSWPRSRSTSATSARGW